VQNQRSLKQQASIRSKGRTWRLGHGGRHLCLSLMSRCNSDQQPFGAQQSRAALLQVAEGCIYFQTPFCSCPLPLLSALQTFVHLSPSATGHPTQPQSQDQWRNPDITVLPSQAAVFTEAGHANYGFKQHYADNKILSI